MLDPAHPLAELLRRDDRYKFEAYVFVFEALKHAQELFVSSDTSPTDAEDEGLHVSGQQLCEAIRQYAVQQYGLLAKHVLNSWGVYATGDFGEIVFNLIEIEQMRKTNSDRREDFEDVFDFSDGLRDTFQPITTTDTRKEQ